MAFKSRSQSFKYQEPDPFALPTIENRESNQFTGNLAFLNQFLPVTPIPREGLHYSASVIEEIMKNITEENKTRGNQVPSWKKYKTGTDGNITSETFTDPNKEGTNLQDQPVEFFPLIVRDIQTEIEKLISDSTVPDTLAGYFARIFANNTINHGTKWNNVKKIPSLLVVNTTNGQENVTPLANAKAGSWPLSADLIGRIVTVVGVSSTDPSVQQANISTTGEGGKIEVTDPNFPQSPYGAGSPVPGTKGVEMTDSNRTVFNKINVSDSSLGVGAGKGDPDMGYGHLSSVGHMIEQLRYQPPSVEAWPNNVGVAQYASNLFSNTTPNLPWVLSLPVETQILQNWGFWLIKGNVGVTGNAAFIRAFNTPSASDGGIGNCPFAVFFPPPVVSCGCVTGDSAYFIWHSQSSGFSWNDLILFQNSNATPRFFGPNTKLTIDATVAGGAGGSQSNSAFFGVGIRTARVSNVNLQPFHFVIAQDTQNPNNLALAPFNKQATGFSVNIMEQMNKILGDAYPIGGRDAIEAIQILVQTASSANWTCDSEDGPTGRFVPASCSTIESCSAGDMTAVVSNLRIEEPAIVGDPVANYV